MKNIILSFLVIILFAGLTYPQKMKEKVLKNRYKLEQLEKIKLIESLDMNEETSIKFFSRRNDFKKEIQELEQKLEAIFAELEKSFNSESKNQTENQKRLISETLKTRESIEMNRNQFISSLNDILTVEQISKLIVFEKKFKDEIRQVLFNKKRH